MTVSTIFVGVYRYRFACVKSSPGRIYVLISRRLSVNGASHKDPFTPRDDNLISLSSKEGWHTEEEAKTGPRLSFSICSTSLVASTS